MNYLVITITWKNRLSDFFPSRVRGGLTLLGARGQLNLGAPLITVGTSFTIDLPSAGGPNSLGAPIDL